MRLKKSKTCPRCATLSLRIFLPRRLLALKIGNRTYSNLNGLKCPQKVMYTILNGEFRVINLDHEELMRSALEVYYLNCASSSHHKGQPVIFSLLLFEDI